jgi:hypothetical protein
MKPSQDMSTDTTDSRIRNQDVGQFFSSMSPWALFAFIVILCILVMWGGAWIGHLRFLRGITEPEGPISTAVGSILGLLAFLLGFTFSLTWSRYSSRNSMVILQAQAIETCYLRTSFLPQKQKEEIRARLRDYINLLLELQPPRGIEETVSKLEALHIAIWQQTASLAKEDIDSELRSLYISSFNEIMSLSLERKTVGMFFRIPDPIWSSLLFLAAMSMFSFGYQTGNSGVRRIFGMPFLPIAFGLVIVLIADLNSTGVQRRFKVSQKPLKEVLEMMNKEIP